VRHESGWRTFEANVMCNAGYGSEYTIQDLGYSQSQAGWTSAGFT
jgi:hypothetical protein